MSVEKFTSAILDGYSPKGDFINLGAAVYEGSVIPDAKIQIPLSMFSRHGLIAGATGTGKTKTVQKICELLSEKGVPSLVMDIKGDLSGIAKEGSSNPKIEERHKAINQNWAASKLPVEMLTISHEKGLKMRATVSEFGPVLFSKMLELNDTQAGVVSIIFKYCDDKGYPLLDLKDFRTILQYIQGEGEAEITSSYGSVATTTIGTILRKVIELEEQGADLFFGETSFDVNDLGRTDSSGNGFINVIRLRDIQSQPKLFSTFMLCLLAEVYEKFPEEGDIQKPKLCIFIDEAHLIFNQASKNLMDQIEMIIKLIRSKGVGVYFITQSPTDVPAAVLGQLGLKIQHALRAFTANDRKAIKLTSENYPITEFYKIETLLTELGIGEALVTALNEKGNPTPLAHVMLAAPQTRMDILTDSELDEIVNNSSLKDKYNQVIDRESAFEILTKKLEQTNLESNTKDNSKEEDKENSTSEKKEKSLIESLSKNTMVRQLGRTATKEITRGLLGIIGFKK
jgi:uncharacterized protein